MIYALLVCVLVQKYLNIFMSANTCFKIPNASATNTKCTIPKYQIQAHYCQNMPPNPSRAILHLENLTPT